jgi:pSer/pThr/pTyr-binding forkhead associated (FHA) protein
MFAGKILLGKGFKKLSLKMSGKIVTKDYEKPSWSSLPAYDTFSLEIIKNGVVVDEIPLKDREYWLLGRQPDVVDIQLDHESISRKHAVLNFRNDGKLMMKDFGSAQGSWINKQICEKDKFYQLNVGDVLKFGCSSRIYVVKGPEVLQPEEVESDELRTLREKAVERAATMKTMKVKEKDGISWGMNFDDNEEDEEENQKNTRESAGKGNEEEEDSERFRRDPSKFSQDLKRSFLPEYLRKDENYDRKYGDKFAADIREDEFHSEKDKKALENIRKKELKIQNMQQENKRIYLKENSQEDGLSQGQLNVIERNDKAVELLKEEIDQLVSSVRQKNDIRDLSSEKSGGNKRRKGDEDDDEVHNRHDDEGNVIDLSHQATDISTNWRLKKKLQKLNHVVSSSSSTSAGSASNYSGGTHPINHQQPHKAPSSSLDYQQLRKEMDELSEKKLKLENKIAQLTMIRNQSQTKKPDAIDDDEVDLIIQQDVQREVNQKLKQLQYEVDEMNFKMKNLEKLVNLATPALKSLVEKQPTISPKNQNLDSSNQNQREFFPSQTGSSSGSKESPTITNRKNPLVLMKKESEDENRIRSFEEFQKAIEMEKEKDPVPLSTDGTTTTAATSLKPEIVRTSKEEFKTPKIKGPARPEPLSDSPKNKQNKSIHPPAAPVVYSKNQLQDGDYIWLPPTKQKGDGKTSLNDKFGY